MRAAVREVILLFGRFSIERRVRRSWVFRVFRKVVVDRLGLVFKDII